MTGWPDATVNEFTQTLLDYWPHQFRTKAGQLRNKTILAWITALDKFSIAQVLAALADIKAREEKDYAPAVSVVVKEVSNRSATPGRAFPVRAYGHSVTINGQVWTAASSGCYGPGGFWCVPKVPQNVFDAICFTAPAEQERYPTAQEVAANDALWRGRVDHGDEKTREFYRKLRHAMAHGEMPVSVTTRMREPGED